MPLAVQKEAVDTSHIFKISLYLCKILVFLLYMIFVIRMVLHLSVFMVHVLALKRTERWVGVV